MNPEEAVQVFQELGARPPSATIGARSSSPTKGLERPREALEAALGAVGVDARLFRAFMPGETLQI